MNFPDVLAAAQSAAITVVFLFISYKLPNLIQGYQEWQRSMQKGQHEEAERVRQANVQEATLRREHELREREADRKARHESVDAFQRIILEMWQQHDQDAKADREAEDRRLEVLIARLESVIRSSCRWRADE